MNERNGPAKILIVDDHPLVREGMTALISMQPDLIVGGEAATEDEALALVQESSPDLVIVDIALLRGHGLELTRQIKARYPAVKILVVSGYQESLYAERALRAGAHGYLNKQEPNEKLLIAIRTVLAGERFISPAVMQRLVGEALGSVNTAKTQMERLTNRELEVFQLIGEGLNTGAIARKLFLSTHTIDTHRENIKRKLGIRHSGELTRAAVLWLLESDK